MRGIIFLLSVTTLTGCHNPPDADRRATDGASKLRAYSEIHRLPSNSLVRVRGIAAVSHEKFGIYFRRRDYARDSSACLRLDGADISRFRLKDALKVDVVGRVTRSKCAEEWICLEVCTEYDIKIERVRPLGSLN